MFDILKLELIFECQLCKDFNQIYRKLDKNFYCFELYNALVGLNFLSQEDGENMQKYINLISIKSKIKEKFNFF